MADHEEPQLKVVPQTKVAYVGLGRYKKLKEAAIDFSSVHRTQITPSQLLQFLVDKYTDDAMKELIKDFSKWAQWETRKND